VAEKLPPEIDCPSCPECKSTVGTPVHDRRGERLCDRHAGDDDARLYCPACGHGWRGTDAELEQAQDAWDAYARSEGWIPAAPSARPPAAQATRADDPRQLLIPGTVVRRGE
jgi:hypothetical protein